MLFIVKYSGSKFYAGGYLTLRMIAQLVLQGRRIKVTCANTKKDITRETVVDALGPVLKLQSSEFLKNLVESLR